MASFEAAMSAKPYIVRALESIRGVNGIGIAKKENEYFIKVNVEQTQVHLPSEVLGVPLVKEVVGKNPQVTRRLHFSKIPNGPYPNQALQN